MNDYKSKVNSYDTPNGVKWRVEYAYKTPDGVYHRSCKRGFDSRDKAEKWQMRELYRLIDEKEKEKPPVSTSPAVVVPAMETSESKPITTMTMDELIAEYIDIRVSSRKASTQVTKLNIINKKILPYFTGKRVIDIKTIDVEKWLKIINEMETEDGFGLSNTYKYTIRGQLGTIMKYAVKVHGLPSNPVANTDPIGAKRAKKQPFLELSEYAKFRNVAAEKPRFFYFWELLFWTGMRSGEAKSLTLSDINFDKKFIRVYKTLSNANLPLPPSLCYTVR